MKKIDFMRELSIELRKTVSSEEADKALLYYGEFIDDAVDCGDSEAQAIAKLPSTQQIVQNILNGLDIYDNQQADYEQVAQEQIPTDEPQRVCYAPTQSPNTKSFKQKIKDDTRMFKEDIHNVGKSISKSAKEFGQRLGSDVKEKRIGRIVAKIVLLLLFSIIALPVMLSLIITVAAVLISLWALCLCLLIVGVIAPIYAAIVGIMGSSAAVFLSFMAAGMVVLALGFLLTKLMLVVSKYFGKAIAGLAKATVKMYSFSS